MNAGCSHIDQIDLAVQPSSLDGCSECLRIGASWVHLRMCMICGEVGCCDSSPNRHATKHSHATSHPVISSREPGEEWLYCLEGEVTAGAQEPGQSLCKPTKAVGIVDGTAWSSAGALEIVAAGH